MIQHITLLTIIVSLIITVEIEKQVVTLSLNMSL